MSVANLFKLLAFTNDTIVVKRIHRTVAGNPSTLMWWALTFIALNMVLPLPFDYLVHLGVKAPAVSSEIMLHLLLAMTIIGILIMDVLVIRSIRRRQRKSSGGPLTE